MDVKSWELVYNWFLDTYPIAGQTFGIRNVDCQDPLEQDAWGILYLFESEVLVLREVPVPLVRFLFLLFPVSEILCFWDRHMPSSSWNADTHLVTYGSIGLTKI